MELERWRQLIETGRTAAQRLPVDSPTRRAASPGWFDGLSLANPPYGNDAPPLLLHLNRLSPSQLADFDADLLAVRSATSTGQSRIDVLDFGRDTETAGSRQWSAGLLEMGVQAQLIRALGPARVELSPDLPNGRTADAVLDLGGRRVWLEISALSDDNSSIAEFDTAKSVQLLHGDPYLDARRLYRKVFDKAAGPAPALRSQLHPDEPSIVVVGDATWRAAGFDGLGFGWALDQLTDPATRDDRSAASLIAWLDHDYPGQVAEALAALACLSAVAVVAGDLGLLEYRANQAVDYAHELRFDEAEELRRLLGLRPSWIPG
jgi:hypothetical protein